ncbi:MAG: type II toxin-antitoxin system RelE/ParE family toxin [Chitinivibrionales bacterium]|nr:type II toxin-antitoxin system RelE/ParE family toxin [Chitinivibrionales bacterium]
MLSVITMQNAMDWGFEFLWEVFAAIDRIKHFPDAWQEFFEGIRRGLVKRFPYGVIYLVDGNAILIFGIAHLHRPPEYYISRIK